MTPIEIIIEILKNNTNLMLLIEVSIIAVFILLLLIWHDIRGKREEGE